MRRALAHGCHVGTTLLPGMAAAAFLHRQSHCAAASTTVTTSSFTSRRNQSPETNLQGKVVLITGASAGIGRSCAWRFAEKDCKLVLLARRGELLDALKQDLIATYPSLQVHTVVMSVTDLESVAALPAKLPKDFADVYCLVNNAGLALGVSSVDQNNAHDAKTMLDSNVLGTIAFCSAFVPGMKQRGAGHIVNMGSCAGQYAYANGSAYNASKYAIHGFTEASRHDLAGTPIRVTHIAPGLVSNTEFSIVRLAGDKDKAEAVYSGIEALQPEDVADNVLYAVTRPPHVQIADILMYCTNQSGPRDVQRVGKTLGRLTGTD